MAIGSSRHARCSAGRPAAKLTDQISGRGRGGGSGGATRAAGAPRARRAPVRRLSTELAAAPSSSTAISPVPSTVAWAPPASYSTSSSSPSSPAVQGRSQEPPGKSSGVGGMTLAPGASVGRRGSIGSGSVRRASCSRSSSWIASSLPGIRPRRSGTRPARRLASRGRGWASPRSRRRARGVDRRRSRPGTRCRAARVPPRPRRARRRRESAAPARRSWSGHAPRSAAPTRRRRAACARC